MTSKTQAAKNKGAQEAEAKAAQEAEAKAAQEAEAKAAQDAEAKAAQEAEAKAAQKAKPQGKQGEIPALFIRTTRRFKSRRRAGFRFTREGHGIALDALTDDQVASLKADPALEVEECTFPADEAEA